MKKILREIWITIIAIVMTPFIKFFVWLGVDFYFLEKKSAEKEKEFKGL